MRFFDTAGAGLLLAATAMSVPAFAQDDPIIGGGGPLSLSGEIAVVSDYRFRGISLSDEEIALQPTLTLSHDSGLYDRDNRLCARSAVDGRQLIL